VTGPSPRGSGLAPGQRFGKTAGRVMTRLQHSYLDVIARRAREPGRTWFLAQWEQLGAERFGVAFAGTGRRLGADLVELDAGERAQLLGAGVSLPEGWALSTVGRAALLCGVCTAIDPAAQLGLVVSQFKTGDNAEREAILKALPLLPGPERFVELAIDACRSHVQTVFEAIACENPYPGRFFPEANFNQLVLKAFFTGVPVRRILLLNERRTPELARMALGYASERRAAGRSVPADLDTVTGEPSHERGGNPA
jgi:hypothetical protein